VERLLDVIGPAPSDRFIEIGAGRGALTEPLAARSAAVLAVEIDRDLASALAGRHLPRVTVLARDILEVHLVDAARSLGATPVDPVRVAGNLPYNISSPILFRLLEAAPSGLFRDATLMLQREVAERLVARPGTREYGVLALCSAIHADVVHLLSLPPGAFRPMPAVHSAVVRLSFRPPPEFVRAPDTLVAIVRSVFTQRRKTIGNALESWAAERGLSARRLLADAAVDPRARPEELDLAAFARLADAVQEGIPKAAPESRST
jgi:16S rRNA (adenine1518-N6/adenine1519-N6)-dimethyltransferase